MSGLTKAEVGSLGVDQVVVRYSTGDFVSGENGILLGLWVPCLKFARYTGVPEGKYQFRLYARDMAGNEAQQVRDETATASEAPSPSTTLCGCPRLANLPRVLPQLSSKMIAVNATLRVPAWAQEFESESRPWWHWLVVALAGGLFLTVVVLLGEPPSSPSRTFTGPVLAVLEQAMPAVQPCLRDSPLTTPAAQLSAFASAAAKKTRSPQKRGRSPPMRAQSPWPPTRHEATLGDPEACDNRGTKTQP